MEISLLLYARFPYCHSHLRLFLLRSSQIRNKAQGRRKDKDGAIQEDGFHRIGNDYCRLLLVSCLFVMGRFNPSMEEWCHFGTHHSRSEHPHCTWILRDVFKHRVSNPSTQAIQKTTTVSFIGN